MSNFVCVGRNHKSRETHTHRDNYGMYDNDDEDDEDLEEEVTRDLHSGRLIAELVKASQHVNLDSGSLEEYMRAATRRAGA